MEQVERIQHMEEILRRAEKAVHALEDALDSYEDIQDGLKQLSAYYGSEDWFHDLDCDRRGLLPADLLRGVLSEDEVYDLLTDCYALRDKMRTIGASDESSSPESQASECSGSAE